METSSTEITLKENRSSGFSWIRQNWQMLLAVGTAIVFIFKFYFTQVNDHAKIQSLETDVKVLQQEKADKGTVDANQKNTQDRLQRMYETNNTFRAEMSEVKQNASYEKGYHDAEKNKK